MFVDDTGRRRRVGRLVAGFLGTVLAGYVTVIGLTFAGAPLVWRLAPPGIDRLARPAGDEGVGVGPDAHESVLPAAAAPGAAASGASTTTPTTSPDGGVAAASATMTTAPTTTTTTTPGQGTSTSVPTPSSTVPDNTHTTGKPTEPPGKP